MVDVCSIAGVKYKSNLCTKLRICYNTEYGFFFTIKSIIIIIEGNIGNEKLMAAKILLALNERYFKSNFYCRDGESKTNFGNQNCISF